MNYLFAIDPKTEEIVVSKSPKGSFKIEAVERIGKNNHAVLFHAVSALTLLSREKEVNMTLLKAIDAACQKIYLSHLNSIG
jgi:hypothetical protein